MYCYIIVHEDATQLLLRTRSSFARYGYDQVENFGGVGLQNTVEIKLNDVCFHRSN